MIKRVIHISDIHIPNSDDGRPYSKMMMGFIDDVTEQINHMKDNEDIDESEIRIVIVGDIFHQKIKTSNEAKMMFHEMLNAFNKLAKTIIVAGNHDMLENNTDRTDSISPTFEISGAYENVIYADKVLGYKSGCIKDDNILWAVYSMFDKFARPDIDKYNTNNLTVIGLYHGDIVGATTDTGRVSDSGIDTNSFVGCKCIMAGHIHKFQEIIKNDAPIVYPSSVFQQNIGENTTKHGYVIWNVETMQYALHEVSNDYKIYKFEITSYNDVENNVEKLINL